MNGSMLLAVMAGTILMGLYPIILLIFGVLAVRAGRREELTAASSQASLWLSGIGVVSLLLALVGSVSRQSALNWASITVVIIGIAPCGWFLRTPLTRPLKVVSGLLLFELLFVAAFGSFALWVADKAIKISAYNNTNETEVRTAIAKNPNDAAAHSSLAHIDLMRGSHEEEIREWRQVLRVEPNNEEALLLLGARLTQSGRTAEARPLYRKLAAGQGDFRASAHKWLARHGEP